MNTCQTCSFWTRKEGFLPDTFEDIGKCSSLKFVYTGNDPWDEPRPPDDALQYADAEGYNAWFLTGQNFGCIHHQTLLTIP